LAEAEAKIAKLNTELLLKSESFEQEKQKFNAKFETEVEKSSNLQKSLKPAMKNLILRLKTCQGPSNISRVKLMPLMKL
jgi:hypothetical protein